MTDPTADQPVAGAGEPGRECPWCATPAAPEATHCGSCGAALAQRESIGDLQIPGLTSVDPALLDYDKRPLDISGPSPTQGLAPALILGAVSGGAFGLAAIGGVALLAGAEFQASDHDGTDELELAEVGKPSEVLLLALENEDDWAASETGADGAGTKPDDELDAADADHGMSIWRDLPPEDLEAEAMGGSV